MRHFDPERGGGGICPEHHGNCDGKRPWGRSVHMLHIHLNAKTVELSAGRIVQGRWVCIPVKIVLSRCFGYQNGERSSTTISYKHDRHHHTSTTECLRWECGGVGVWGCGGVGV